jgi:hypothetical protein
MEPVTESFYQLLGQYYLGDGVYLWHDVEGPCNTLEECLECKENALMYFPEYVDFMIEHRVVTTTLVMGPENGIESDMER